MWIGVRQRFRALTDDLVPTSGQLSDGLTKHLNVGKSLQRTYYGESDERPPCFLVGSWGKNTQVRPPQDVDMFFVLPSEVKARFDLRTGNIQSALLQEVKGALEQTYPQTRIRGDGQVVSVGFNTVTVEVVPAFVAAFGGQFIMPDTNGGGSWKFVDPVAQMQAIQAADQATAGNTRALSRIMKHWRNHCAVPLKSFVLELLVADFISTYRLGTGFSGAYDTYWYDYYVRDFLGYLIGRANGFLAIPGTGESYFLWDDWLPKATTAWNVAVVACGHEVQDFTILAGEEWQKLFGNRIPVHVL